MNVLDLVMGVNEAAEMWGLGMDRVKRLCQEDEIVCKKIGKTWVIYKGQDNPKKYNSQK